MSGIMFVDILTQASKQEKTGNQNTYQPIPNDFPALVNYNRSQLVIEATEETFTQLLNRTPMTHYGIWKNVLP